ncbi:hypothetical protein [Actinophytocola oryzae]|uniref:Uncharacterized protein n=1 Tax=Actinophytocola oryzae TaxID=502181 RepID=A0A4R7UR36_9PSEU|nr:hypothetical protein [Actinophytocola oryzae]TDV35316.1 hypothetical protein CLV71_13631 [Actinophytocola oryzae]
MKERILADLDDRIARHLDGDSSGVLDRRALELVSELTDAAPDAGALARVAALHLCRSEALPPEGSGTDRRLAYALYTKLHAVDPRLVPPQVREFFDFPAPHDDGVARLREYEESGRLSHLERAISLFRQEMLEDGGDQEVVSDLAAALRLRYERTGQQTDLDEATELTRPRRDRTH